MRIVIFTGGTGSIALQRGLYHALDESFDGVDTKIIVNAYDNGLSTGAVRRVMNGQILGPSDIRKNQTTRLQLGDPDSPWLPFLNDRFTVQSTKAHYYCNHKAIQLIEDLERRGSHANCRNMLRCAIEEYFNSPIAVKIDYNNFSLANIIYAGLSRANGNSLRAAASIMAEAMSIPDNVLLNDDVSLFLGAITQAGQRITDEGAIVSWGNETDPFVDIFFSDVDGHDTRPELCLEAWRAIVEADLIILSSGTLWSSLIPTYASGGFKAAINDSKAKILMVVNRTPDNDSPSQTASDMINVLVPRYFDAGRLHVVADNNSHPTMRSLNESALSKVAFFSQADLSRPADPADKHNSTKLADAIAYSFFKDYLDSNFYLFDYDDTLVGRGNTYPRSSRFNIEGISRLNRIADVGICTGNTIKAIDLKVESTGIDEAFDPIYKPLLVFADGGGNKYLYDTHPMVKDDGRPPDQARCIWPDALLPTAGPHSANKIVEALRRAGIPRSKIDNRGNALIAVKPVDQEYRRALLCLAQHIIRGSDLEVRESGKTTAEICKPVLSKMCALRYLCTNLAMRPKITYVGDELESGNDQDVEELATEEMGVKCLHVGTPAKTAFFMATLLAHLTKNVKR